MLSWLHQKWFECRLAEKAVGRCICRSHFSPGYFHGGFWYIFKKIHQTRPDLDTVHWRSNFPPGYSHGGFWSSPRSHISYIYISLKKSYPLYLGLPLPLFSRILPRGGFWSSPRCKYMIFVNKILSTVLRFGASGTQNSPTARAFIHFDQIHPYC